MRRPTRSLVTEPWCRMPREQEQFLDVVDRDEAERRWRSVIARAPLGSEQVALNEALGRVLAVDVKAAVDVPAFDRSNVDGYAVRAIETFGASEDSPNRLWVNPEEAAMGVVPRLALTPTTATPIATGGMLPRGADAVVMVETTRLAENGELLVHRPVAPGSGLSFAGTDMGRGELVLRRGTLLTSRETGVLAAIGEARVTVFRRPRVAIISTGDELVAPGSALPPASIYDSNATILADAVRELGGVPIFLGIAPDDARVIDFLLDQAIERSDLVLLSGGTSKGAGDLSYHALARRSPGIVVHGVALKPGKPICLGAIGAIPVAILPGFPTSSIFTFHEFITPLIRSFAGRAPGRAGSISATLPARVNSEPGRTEYLLVNLVSGPSGWTAYPMGKGSGSVSAFSRADGFLVIPKQQEYLEAGERVEVVPLGKELEPADLVVIGSHCSGLDLILGELVERGWRSKTIWVGSQGGLTAAARQECDVAGVHLLEPLSWVYNTPFLPQGVRLVPGYSRMQGLVSRPDDARFAGILGNQPIEDARTGRLLTNLLKVTDSLMINRNRGSGTRVLTDWLLDGRKPSGYAVEARSHNSVAAAVAQGRADWGIAIEPIAREYGLAFQPIQAEQYDFAIPESRWDRPPVVAFRAILINPTLRARLEAMGFTRAEGAGATTS